MQLVIKVDGTDDQKEFDDTLKAMETMNMNNDEQSDVLQVVSGKLLIFKFYLLLFMSILSYLNVFHFT